MKTSKSYIFLSCSSWKRWAYPVLWRKSHFSASCFDGRTLYNGDKISDKYKCTFGWEIFLFPIQLFSFFHSYVQLQTYEIFYIKSRKEILIQFHHLSSLLTKYGFFNLNAFELLFLLKVSFCVRMCAVI